MDLIVGTDAAAAAPVVSDEVRLDVDGVQVHVYTTEQGLVQLSGVDELVRLVGTYRSSGLPDSGSGSKKEILVDTDVGLVPVSRGAFWIDVQLTPTEPGTALSDEDAALDADAGVVAATPLSDSARAMAVLQSLFKLHPLTVGDIIGGGTLDKVEIFDPDYTFVVVHEPNFNEGFSALTDTVPIGVVLLADAVLSVHVGPTRSVGRVQELVSIGRLPSNPHIFSGLVSVSTDLYAPLVDQVEDEVGGLEDLVLVLSQHEQGDLLRRFAWCRRHIADLGKVLRPKREILQRLVKTEVPHLPRAVKTYVRDPLDHVTRLLQQTSATRDLLEASLTTYDVKVSIENATVNQRINDVMKRFSAVATIMLPLSLVAGLWGMNVGVPGQNSAPGDYTWFGALCGAMAAFAIIMMIVFRKLRWL